MTKILSILPATLVCVWAQFANLAIICAANANDHSATLTLKSTEESSSLKHAAYLKASGLEMIKGPGFYSSDNGRTWVPQPSSPDFDSKLPYGYRRGPYPLFVDPVNGNVIQLVLSLDTPGLDPSVVEPPIGEERYYLRYRVSKDGGKSFLFDEPIVQHGMTLEHPFNEVYRDKTGIYVGDSGSQFIRASSGRIIIPSQVSKLGLDGKPWNPGGGWTYTDAIMIIGSWQDDGRLRWEASEFIRGDPARSTRGMIEPTLAEMPDGRLLCVMRGSNGGTKDPEHKLPSYKWYSVSDDGGFHWTEPEPWTYDDGGAFYSPSSMSELLRHSSGRCFWIGNISPTNCEENDPRYPLVIGEVDSQSMTLIKSTVLVLDTKRPDEAGINLSHWWGLEDRASKDIILAGDRHSLAYKGSKPITYRVSVGKKFDR